MLRLRKSILAHLLSSPASSPVSPLHRLLSAAAPAISTQSTGFAIEDYLVDTCGLTRAQVLKASAKLCHLRSPAKPDAVLAFLAGLGLSTGDVVALVAKDPLFLCASVEKTLAPVVAGLSGLGVSRSEMTRLVSVSGSCFRSRSIVPALQYCLPLFASSEDFLRAARMGCDVLKLNPERTAKPKVRFLQECGLGACDIAKLCGNVPWLLSTKLERLQTMVALAEGLGVPRGSGMFRHALHVVSFVGKKKMAARVDYLKKTFRWSDVEVSIAVPKALFVLRKSKESLRRRSEFFFSEVGLEPVHIARWPVMLMYSLEGRIRPRYYVVKFLKENELLKRDPSYNALFNVSEDVFVARFIYPHKKVAPQLAEDYAVTCCKNSAQWMEPLSISKQTWTAIATFS